MSNQYNCHQLSVKIRQRIHAPPECSITHLGEFLRSQFLTMKVCLRGIPQEKQGREHSNHCKAMTSYDIHQFQIGDVTTLNVGHDKLSFCLGVQSFCKSSVRPRRDTSGRSQLLNDSMIGNRYQKKQRRTCWICALIHYIKVNLRYCMMKHDYFDTERQDLSMAKASGPASLVHSTTSATTQDVSSFFPPRSRPWRHWVGDH